MTLDSPLQPYDWTFRRVAWSTLAFISVILAFWLFYRFNQVVFILFIGILIGTVIRPTVSWLRHRGIPPTAGVMLVYVVLLVMLTGFLLLLFPVIIKQGATILAAIPGYYLGLRQWMQSLPNGLVVRLGDLLPVALPNVAPAAGQQMMASAGQALGYVAVAVRVLFLAIVILVIAYYWTLDGPRIIQTLLLFVPQDQREGTRELVLAMESKVGSYIIGQGFLCLVVGTLALLAYVLIGLPNALVLALMAGVLEAVPMLGPVLGALPAALVALSIAPSKLLWLILATFIIQELENSLLVPRVMSKAVGVNPFVTIVALFAFSSLFGIAGALMAIPIAAIIQLLLNRFVFPPAATEMEMSAGRDHVSRLRYEAQVFARGLRRQARIGKGGSDQRIKEIDQVMDEIETIATDLDGLLASASAAANT